MLQAAREQKHGKPVAGATAPAFFRQKPEPDFSSGPCGNTAVTAALYRARETLLPDNCQTQHLFFKARAAVRPCRHAYNHA